MALNHKPILLADSLVQITAGRNPGQVQDRTAATANKVTVRRNHSVKPLLALNHSHALNHAALLEKEQVTVYRSQAEVGVLRLQLAVYPLGGWVAVGCPDDGQDGFPLFTIAYRAFHLPLPLTILILVMLEFYHILFDL